MLFNNFKFSDVLDGDDNLGYKFKIGHDKHAGPRWSVIVHFDHVFITDQ